MSKEEIRNNREALRSKLKGSFIAGESASGNISPPGSQKGQTRRKRHMSQDFSLFQILRRIPQIYTQKTLEEDYKIMEKIGQGTESVVYKCIQISSGKTFSVKIIKTSEPQTVQRIKQNFLILKDLRHQNILEAHCLYIDEQRRQNCVVMEYYPFSTLEQFLCKNQSLRCEQIQKILYQLIKGVKYLHGQGVAHRDIKPENIMYDADSGRVVIIDFEISKKRNFGEDTFQMLSAIGTLHYKAPEMFDGYYNQQVDIWAVGVIAYRLFYGTFPFDSQFQKDCIQLIASHQPKYPQNNCLTKFAEEFIKGCLQKQPLKRFNATQALSTSYFTERQLIFLNSAKFLGCESAQRIKGKVGVDRYHKASASTSTTHSGKSLQNLNEQKDDDQLKQKFPPHSSPRMEE